MIRSFALRALISSAKRGRPALPTAGRRMARCQSKQIIAEPLATILEKFANDAYLVYFYIKLTKMARQSISFTKPNDEWLKNQVDNEEYSSKSELVNDLIRQARNQQVQIDWIRNKLEKAEKSGFTDDTKSEILEQSKALLNG